MKILFLTTHLNIGGITSYIITLAKALKAKGHDVFIASGGGELLAELDKSGIPHIKLDIITKAELSPKVFRAIFEITSIVKRLNIDIIHSQTRVTQVAGFFASRLSKIKLVTTCHGFFRQNIGRRILPSWGEQVIAISEAVQRHLIDDFHVDKDKVSLIYNGIDVKKFIKDFSEEEKLILKDRYGIRKDCAVIGTIARFTPDKGHDILLYALRDILKEKSNVQLVFVGDGKEYSKVVDLAAQLNLSENVVFVRSQLDTVGILSIMDVFMFTPKRKEGLGLALLEALASGKAVVATNTGGIPNVIEDNVNGFLVPPANHRVLVEPVLKLLEDKDLYKKMSHAARQKVIEKFSIDGMVDKVEKVYHEVI